MSKTKRSNILFAILCVVALAELVFCVFYMVRNAPAEKPAGKPGSALVRPLHIANA